MKSGLLFVALVLGVITMAVAGIQPPTANGCIADSCFVATR